MPSEMMDVRATIRDFVQNDLAISVGINAVHDDDALHESGIVDSLQILRLVTFLEDTFGIQIQEDEIISEHFHTIASIDQFVTAKRSS
jgi:acyl carrier protein